jgi:WD40 repeat protein
MPKHDSPYVGPRPFEREHATLFFGRDREANELVSLIISHTEVLLYAQSGAGKSSLVNARVIPLLEAEDFDVLPPARVQGVVEGVAAEEIGNIYAFHSLMTWAGREADPKRFARMSLADFLRERKCPVDEAGTPVLRIAIFDQFEELFTFYPERWQERRAFFTQVREASKTADRGLRTVFVMREDHVAEVDPYASILPEKFRNRFRLERMLEQRALACVQEPLKSTARRFAPGVAEALIDQLLRLEIAAPDGKPMEAKEQFVELVQLQVVCQSLWDQLRPDDDEIGMDDLTSADPKKALLNFYERCVQQTAERTHVPEARIRLWFERALITPAGTRGTVFREEHDTQGLPNVAVDALENLHLIRGEVRGRGRWYELTHDRFIESVQISRRQWREANAATEAARRRLEAAAQQWALLGRGKEGLLDEGQLFEAKRLLNLPDVERLGISDTSRSLVDLSQVVIDQGMRRKEDQLQAAQSLAAEQQRRAEEQRTAAARQRRIAKILFVVLLIAVGFAVIAVGFAVWALRAESDARTAKTRALDAQSRAVVARMRASVRQLAGQAFRKREDELDLALLLALESRTAAEKLAGTELERGVALTDSTSSVLWTLLGPPGLQRVMHGHAQPVRSVALSADGKMLASGDMDGVVRLWAANGMAPSRKLKSESEFNFVAVYSVAFSPDGHILAACGNLGGGPENNGIMLWKVATASRFGKLQPLTTQGRQVAFSPDGKYLASPSRDKVVLWSVPDLAPSIELQTEKVLSDKALSGALVNCLAFSPNPETLTLAAGGADQVIRLWNIKTRSVQELRRACGEKNQLFSLAFNPEGDRLASGWLDKKIIVWDLKHPDAPEILAGHFSPVFALTFSPDGKTLVSGGSDRTVKRWDLSITPKKSESLSGYAQEIYSLAANEKNEIFAGTGKGTIAVWNLGSKDLRLVKPINLPLHEKEFVQCVSLLGEHGQMLAFGASTGRIFLWNLVNAKLWGEPLVGSNKPVLCIGSSPDGKTWASGSEEGIIFWNAAGEPRGQVHNEKGAVSALAFRPPDGLELASNTAGGEIVFWDVARQIPLSPPLGDPQAGHVNSLAFSPDGKQLAAGDADEKVFLWDANTRTRIGTKPLCEFNNPTYSPVFSVAFSSKGQVAAAGGDPKIKVCNTPASGSNLRASRLEKHKSEVTSLAFSPDGQMLVSASRDGALILWDVPSGQFVSSLLVGNMDAEKAKPISGVVFSPDGSRLVSAGSEVVVWDLSPEGWLERAGSIAGRNFTADEWKVFLPDEENYRRTFPQGLLLEAHEAALKADSRATADAEKAYRDLIQWISQGKNADLNYRVGLWGILDGFAPAVAAACENAVAMAPPETAWEHRDLRGVARALTGRIEDAIEDLEAYVQRAQGEKLRTREAWLEKLKAGQNPFDAATLEALRSE